MRRRPTYHEPGVIGQDLDPDGPMPQQHRPAKGWEERARQREQSQVQVMGLFGQMTAHLGGLLTLAQAPPQNDVLAQMTQTIPAVGVLNRSWKQQAQAVTISNFGAGTLTVTTQGSQSQAPGVGSGVAIVPPGVERTLQLRGNQVSIYGLAGTVVGIVAFSRPRPPHSAACALGPLDGVLVPAGTTVSTSVTLIGNLERLVIVYNVSAVAGNVQPTINGITASGYVYPLFTGTIPALAATGVTPYRIGPGLTPSVDAVANDVVPRQVQVVSTVTTGATYGVDVIAGP
jgi:hypothetical protein